MADNGSGAGDMDMAEVPLDFEEDLVQASSNTPDSKFDVIIGHIEDIIMEDEFQQLQRNFMDKYYKEFEDTEENKFIYTDIQKEYIDLIEKFLLVNLSERMDDFTMEEFQTELVKRKDELHGEVFEMLLTFSDFVAFKEMFVDYRNDKEGKVVDFSEGFVVRSLSQQPSQLVSLSCQPVTKPMAPQGQPVTKPMAPQGGVHSLQISGHNVMVSMPGAQHYGASTHSLDFAPTAVQISRVNGDCGVARLNCEDVESMNVSPRPDQMDQ